MAEKATSLKEAVRESLMFFTLEEPMFQRLS
ncbi:BnaC03g34020D [Brassica napus]|uniref:BnaC03g34020D protein n=1 Tax=Brassica napus TaxID=3708 RepID=A0A078HSI6_BRANA|nr:BnaC03g34020D [Brassica napus]